MAVILNLVQMLSLVTSDADMMIRKDLHLMLKDQG